MFWMICGIVCLFLLASTVISLGYVLGACLGSGNRRDLEIRLAALRVLLKPGTDGELDDGTIDWPGVRRLLYYDEEHPFPTDRPIRCRVLLVDPEDVEAPVGERSR